MLGSALPATTSFGGQEASQPFTLEPPPGAGFRGFSLAPPAVASAAPPRGGALGPGAAQGPVVAPAPDDAQRAAAAWNPPGGETLGPVPGAAAAARPDARGQRPVATPLPRGPQAAPRDDVQGQVLAPGQDPRAAEQMYVVMCCDDVEIRREPTHSDEARSGEFLSPGQVVPVNHRVLYGGVVFLRLSGGRGWVFESKDQLLVMTEAKDWARGLWHYNVVCEDDVEVRSAPTYSDAHRMGDFAVSGDCVAVDERCKVAGGQFCKLADGRGWLFESKDGTRVLSEVKGMRQRARDFERGLWHYTVLCEGEVEVRAAPTYSDEARTGQFLGPGDCCAVDERCRIQGIWFLKLADGRGWVFESKDRLLVMGLIEG